MRLARILLLPLLLAAAPSVVFSQTFDVVSIKPNTSSTFNSSNIQRPDGGFVMTSIPVGTLVARAYPPAIPADIVGFPDWAMRDRYDFSATSSLAAATPDQRIAMLRAMLADRFKLTVHVEPRPRDVYELVLARSDGRLGPGLKPIDTDCVAQRAAAQAAREAGGPPPRMDPPQVLPSLTPGGPPRLVYTTPPPPCQLRMVSENLDGQGTISDLSNFFRIVTGREVVDKSGLAGFYQITMRFDQTASRRGPETVAASVDAAPTIFTAVQEQLGMKLVSTRVERDTLVIDRLERPTGN